MSCGSISTIIRGIDTGLWHLINHVLCSICHELPNNPVTTPCKHSFCGCCIKKFLSGKDKSGCPLCKHPIKNYSLQQDMVMSTLSRIFQELPQAFISDVQDLQSLLDETTAAADLIKTSKLLQLSARENKAKLVKCDKKKSSVKSVAVGNEQNELSNDDDDDDDNNEVEEVTTFVSVLKGEKNDVKYKNAKRKETDDLISISQTETVSPLSGIDAKESNGKLAGTERVLPCGKVKQWFQSTGDDMLPNSGPLLQTGSLHQNSNSEGKCNERHCPSSMIRLDYKKSVGGKEREAKSKHYVDPYEFLPSQNIKLTNKNMRKSTGEIKRDVEETSIKDVAADVDASKKFKQLWTESDLTEAVQTERHGHTLLSGTGTQLSSIQFSDCNDCSVQCRSENGQERHTPVLPHMSEPDSSESSVGLLNDFQETEKTEEPNLTLDHIKSSMRTSSTSLIRLRSYEALELENGVETYLKQFGGEGKRTRLKGTTEKSNKCIVSNALLDLLEEVYLDDVLYANHPVNAPLQVPETAIEKNLAGFAVQTEKENSVKTVSVLEGFGSLENLTPGSNLIGFRTEQGVPPPRQILRDMIADMEEDLCSGENDFLETHENTSSAVVKNYKEMAKPAVFAAKEEFQGMKSSGSNIFAGAETPENENGFIKFLQAGHLTPLPKRARSSVVKLVFPAGFGRKRFHRIASTFVQPPLHGLPIKGSNTRCQCQNSGSMELASFTGPKARIIVCSKAMQTTSPSSGVTTAEQSAKETELARGMAIATEKSFAGKTSDGQSCEWSSTGVQTSPVSTASVSVQALVPSKLACSVGVQTLKFGSEVVRDHAKTRDEDPCNIEPAGINFDSFESGNFSRPDALVPIKLTTGASQKRKLREDSRLCKKLKTTKQILNIGYEKSTLNKHQGTRALDLGSTSSLHSELIGHIDSVPQNKEVSLSRKTIAYYLNPLKNEWMRKSCHDSTEMPQKGVASAIEIDPVVEVVARGETPTAAEDPRANLGPDYIQPKPQNSCHVFENDAVAEDKSEESDSDLFVEQTPPRGNVSVVAESRRLEGHLILPGGIQGAMNNSHEEFSTNVTAKDTDSNETLRQPEPLRTPLEPKGGRCEAQVSVVTQKNSTNFSESKGQGPCARNERNTPKKNTVASAICNTWKRFDFGQGKKSTLALRKRFHVVASSVHNPERIKKFVSEFKMEYSSKAKKGMTHLIVGLHENDDGEVLPLCTPKLLFAMANKIWVVSEAWAEASLKASKVVDENEFETRDPLGGSACRTARLSTERLFNTCQMCLLGTFGNILKEELADLIMDSGGTLVSRPESFSLSPWKMRLIIVDGECLNVDANELQYLHERFRAVVLTRDFLIMSIQSQKLSNFNPYLLHPASPENLTEMGYPANLVCQEESILEM